MLEPMSNQLVAGMQQISQALAQPNLSEEQKAIYNARLSEIRTELGAMQSIQTGLQNYPSGGTENFHRTNDVFGLGLEIDF